MEFQGKIKVLRAYNRSPWKTEQERGRGRVGGERGRESQSIGRLGGGGGVFLYINKCTLERERVI